METLRVYQGRRRGEELVAEAARGVDRQEVQMKGLAFMPLIQQQVATRALAACARRGARGGVGEVHTVHVTDRWRVFGSLIKRWPQADLLHSNIRAWATTGEER